VDRISVEAIFSAAVQTGPGTHPTSSTMVTGSFLGVKQPGRGADQTPSSSSESGVILRLPLWGFVACSRENFASTFTFSYSVES